MDNTLHAGERAQDAVGKRGRCNLTHRELDDVFGAERCNQLARRAERDHSSVVHNRHAIAQPRGFLHVVGGQEHRPPARLESLDNLPGLAARLRVEAGGGFVEKEQFRVANERAAEREALLLAA